MLSRFTIHANLLTVVSRPLVRGFSKCKYFINHNLLSNGIETETQAWFCGVAVTDGHFRKNFGSIDIGLQLWDHQILKEIIAATEFDQNITFRIYPKGTAVCEIRLLSKKLTNDIHGLFPCDWHNKSATISVPDSLFENADPCHLRGFLRGVSDGDGSFTIVANRGEMSWKFASRSLQFVEAISKIIETGSGVKPLFQKYEDGGKAMYGLSIGKQQHLLAFGDWLYGSQEPELKRKYDRFLVWKNLIESGCRRRDRIPVLKEHLRQELNGKIQVYNDIIALSLNGDATYHFTPSFAKRVHLLQQRVNSWSH